MAIEFYVLDLETNGLMHANGYHEITELSILRCANRTQMSRMVRVLKPEQSSIDALQITGKTLEDLKKGIEPHKLIEDVDNFLMQDGLTPSNRVLVGHNIIGFDKKFLWYLWEKYNKTFQIDMYLDTLAICRDIAKKKKMVKPKLNLGAACELFGVTKKTAGMHNAISDTRNCYLLWDKLMQEIDYLNYIERMPHRQIEETSDDEDIY